MLPFTTDAAHNLTAAVLAGRFFEFDCAAFLCVTTQPSVTISFR